MKKVLLILSLLIVASGGALYALKGKSQYEPGKYSLEIRPADRPFGVGSTLSYRLPDQFGKAHRSSPETQTIAFAFSKNAGHILRSTMEDKPAGYLQKHRAVLIADISGMPTVIQNMFALPDLRKSAYPMLLIYDKEMARRLKEGREGSRVVVMRLQKGKVVAIEQADSPKKLTALLER